MKLLPVFCAVLLLTVVPKGLSAEQPFEGCVAPNTIASLLTRIRERKWQGISVEWVRSNWPTELAGLEYTSESAGSVISRDRIQRALPVLYVLRLHGRREKRRGVQCPVTWSDDQLLCPHTSGACEISQNFRFVVRVKTSRAKYCGNRGGPKFSVGGKRERRQKRLRFDGPAQS